MFNRNFYPTPRPLANLLIEPYVAQMKAGAVILDPSAGKGDLLEACRWAGAKEYELMAIEIEPDLRAILKTKKFRVIGDDFLQYTGNHLFDLVVMNPPFDAGDKHLLAAWEILKHGEIACILNAETIRNPYTQTRRLLWQIICEHGTVEEVGQAFSSGAERRTDAEVCIVRLTKKAEKRPLDFTLPDSARLAGTIDDQADLNNQIARADFVAAMVDSFNQISEAHAQFIEARQKLEFYVNAVKGTGYNPINPAPIPSHITGRQRLMLEHNNYMDAVQSAAWNTVFDRTNFQSVLTSSRRNDFLEFQKQQGGVPFTTANIWAFFEMLFVNRDANLQQCVVEVFDKLTSYHADNKVHWEGWKTNSAWKVNRKVIVPGFVEFKTYSGQRSGTFDIWYQRADALRDIDRAMCAITGRKYEEIATVYDTLTRHFREIGWIKPGDYFQNEIESEFFRIKFWKKGTMHLIFKDENLWNQFNLRAAKGKNWLPG